MNETRSEGYSQGGQRLESAGLGLLAISAFLLMGGVCRGFSLELVGFVVLVAGLGVFFLNWRRYLYEEQFTIFADGFLYEDEAKTFVGWDEITAIVTHQGRIGVTQYRIRLRNGTTIRLPANMSDRDNLARRIIKGHLDYYLPLYMQRIDAGHMVEFGSYALSKDGFINHTRLYSLETLAEIRPDANGTLSLLLIDKRGVEHWRDLTDRPIPNRHVLIGLYRQLFLRAQSMVAYDDLPHD